MDACAKIKTYLDLIDPKINEMLLTTSSLISGSFVLYHYLKENNINPGFEPTDIDIYVSRENGYNNFNAWYDSYVANLPNKDDYNKYDFDCSCWSGDPIHGCYLKN